MAKAKEVATAAEEVLKDNTAEAEVVEAPKDDGMVEIVVPRFLFTNDVYSTHHEFCVNGKIYQVIYDEPVKVPAIVANVARDAIAQRRKVQGLIKAMDGKSKELNKETL